MNSEEGSTNEEEVIELQSQNNSCESSQIDYYWDKNGEVPSFLDIDLDLPIAASSPNNSDLVALGRPFLYNPTFYWPPRALTSEAPAFQFSRIPKPTQPLLEISDHSDNLFYESFLDMGPKAVSPAELAQKLESLYKPWSQEVGLIKISNKVTSIQFEEFSDEYKQMRALFKNLCRSAENGMEEFPMATNILKSINDDFSFLEELHGKNSSRNNSLNESVQNNSQTVGADSDTAVDKRIKQLAVQFDILDRRVQPMLVDVNKNIEDISKPPDPTVALTRKMHKFKIDSETILKESYELDSKISMEIINLSTEEKQNLSKNMLASKLKDLTNNVEQIQTKCDAYLDIVVDESAPKSLSSKSADSTHSTADRLERLPFPRFSGKRVDWLFFKQMFLTHVKYPDEAKRVLALKEKCLSKREKELISKETTLSGCWRKLDAEFGGEASLAREVISQMRSLKTPSNDKQMITFVDSVQNGVSSLRSISNGETYLPTLCLIIEEKLEDETQKAYYRELAKEGEESTYTLLLDFLSREKDTASFRKSTNSTQKKGKEDDEVETVKSNNTNVRSKKPIKGDSKKSDKNDESDTSKSSKSNRNVKNRAKKDTVCVACEGDHATSKCDTWRDDKTEKVQLLALALHILPKRLCPACLEPGHSKFRCEDKEHPRCPCGSDVSMYICCMTDECKSRANWSKVKSNTTAVSSLSTVVNGARIGSTLIPILMVKTAHPKIVLKTLFDNCSQSTFVRNDVAQSLNCPAKPISFVLVCTDGSQSRKTGFMYLIKLVDRFGNIHEIEAIGLENISSKFSGVKVIKPIKLKNGVILSKDKVEFPSGNLDLLVGTDIASIHPVAEHTIKNLVVMSSLFGSGWTLMGHNSNLVKTTEKLTQFKVNFVQVKAVEEISCNLVGTKDLLYLEEQSISSIGINEFPKCSTCKVRSEKCKECKMITKNTTYLEYLQDQQIYQSIEKIPDEPGYIASYPYNNEVSKLLPNKDIAYKRSVNVENTLKKNPADLLIINSEVQKGFDNGVFRFLTDEEISNWDGPIHYLPMNVVYKDSESTPVRLIYDCGQPDRNGRSLNTVMGKGKNPLNHFGSVILNFRAAEQVACGDLKKMFQQIRVRPKDMHMRRFFMRPDLFGGKEEWKIAIPTVVNFGETAAPSIATIVKNKTADDNSHISPDVALMIKKDCVMDDINVSAKYSENLDDNIRKAEEILAPGKFKFKKWIKSGQPGEKQIQGSDVSRSLGLFWKTEPDVLTFKIKLNFSKKKRNRYSAADTTIKSLSDDFPVHMTKRLALKLNHTVFDPACFVQPWILKLRLAFRDILFYEKENNAAGWDLPLPDEFRSQWLKLTEEMFDLESLEFPRSLVPKSYDPSVKPILTLFSDASDLGNCCVGYLVWKLLDGTVHVSFVTSKTKIASLTKISTPKMELVSAQISTRLRCWLRDEMNIEFGKVYHIVDSSIILGMITNVSLKFDTFTAPRVTEIQMNTAVEEWVWTSTDQMPADLGTRGKCTVSDLGVGTMWRNGPDWLKCPESSWPVRSDFRKNEIPGLKKEFEILPSLTNLTQLAELSKLCDENEIKVNSNQVAVVRQPGSVLNLIDVSKYNCFDVIVDKLANIIKCWKVWCKSSVPSLADLRKDAKRRLLLSMMPATREMLKTTKLAGMIIYEKDGMVLAASRNKQVCQNPDDLIVLSPKHPLTSKILYSFHNVNHRGVKYCVARSRIFYWIPQATKLMKSIKDKCYACRLYDSEAMQQLMAPLPDYRLKPSPVWHYAMLDLAGPITVTNFVNQRTTRKTWAVLITCLTTRACWIYPAESYSTDHLLSVLRKHESRNGSPAEYHADLGRQIVGADHALDEAVSSIDQKSIESFAARRGVKFIFGTPHFPEGQGAVERLVAELKSNLKVITRNVLTFGELDTLLSEASYLINCRPLQYNPSVGEDSFLCANDILFGRSDREPPFAIVADTSLTRRAALKQKIVEEFWGKWSQGYLQSLVQYRKWKSKSRNAQPGDVVLLLDKEIAKGKFTIGVIDSVKMDQDKVVRKVIVRYKLQQRKSGEDYLPTVTKYTERNVRGLALLVSAEERNEAGSKNVDYMRFTSVVSRSEEDGQDEAEDDFSKSLQENVGITPSSSTKKLQSLAPSSTGRRRWAPDRFK